jgi:protein-L-isoaspartate(D-aspartate) O-methyltransferase
LWCGAKLTQVDDPRQLYRNVVVVLGKAEDVNNGQPGALGRWLDALELREGDRAYHLGCGVGYYTVIMAEMGGPGGSVVGIDVLHGLAVRSRQNLSGYVNVTVHDGDSATFDPATVASC